jgi:ketosteroid isomerase-like protein
VLVVRAASTGEEADAMQRLLIGGALGALVTLGALVISLTAFGGSSPSSGSDETLQRRADYWAIDELQRNFHKATSKKDIDLMMSLWARNATFTFGPGQPATGRAEIRRAWLDKSAAFEPTNRWVSETPAYKVRVTADGDRGTLHFECHYVDVKTKKVVVHLTADQEVARIDGKWLITDMVVGSAALRP